MSDRTRERPEWVVAGHGNVLHRVKRRREVCSRGRRWWRESFLVGGRVCKLACGRTLHVVAPGILSRLGVRRCRQCCGAVGITYGHGCPINDRTCRAAS